MSSLTQNTFLVQQLIERGSKLIELPKELAILKEVTCIQLENFKNEVFTFCNRVRKLKQQVDNADDEQLNNLQKFMEVGQPTSSCLYMLPEKLTVI